MNINGVEVNLEVIDVKYNGNKILMINEVMKIANVGLAEAKEVVEYYLSK